MVLRRASSNEEAVWRATSTLLPAASDTCEALSVLARTSPERHL